MKYLVAVILGLAIGWLWSRVRGQQPSMIAGNPEDVELPPAELVAEILPSEPPAPDTITSAEPEAEPAPEAAAADHDALAIRLRELLALIDAEINTSAPARELAANPRFLEARRLLAEDTVPVSVVSEYAIGSNWFFSCVALAALCDRADRDEALGDVLSFFDTLSPWGMHFALKALLAADPRPPVGAPLAAIREWWRDNTYVIAAFREHFDERSRLSDEADFGSALEGKPQETQNLVRAFLVRLKHPLATALIESLEAARMRNVDRAFLTSFGNFWKRDAADLLVEPELWADALRQSEGNVLGPQPRSLLVSGETRVGKSSFLRLLGRAPRTEGLDRVRGRRRRADGGAAVLRAAGRPHSAHGGGA